MSEETMPSPEEVKKAKEILEKLHEEKKKEEQEALAKTKDERTKLMKKAASVLEKHVEEKAKKTPSNN